VLDLDGQHDRKRRRRRSRNGSKSGGYVLRGIPESRGRMALVHSSWLLAVTQRLIVATGIANIYARDPMAMANGQRRPQ